jgi:hypothetical protein
MYDLLLFLREPLFHLAARFFGYPLDFPGLDL